MSKAARTAALRRDHIKDTAIMNDYGMGYGMGFGWVWMIIILALAGLAIAALLKYLRK